MSFSETARYFKEKFNIPDSLEKIKSDWNKMARDKYQHEVPLKEGVSEFLDYLRENKIPQESQPVIRGTGGSDY